VDVGMTLHPFCDNLTNAHTYILKINWFSKNNLTNVLILSKDEAQLVFKDIYRRNLIKTSETSSL